MLCQLKVNETVPKSTLNKDGIRKNVCPICAKSFRCQAHLIRHKRIHTGQRPFVCNVSNGKIVYGYTVIICFY